MALKQIKDDDGNYPDELAYYEPTYQCTLCHSILRNLAQEEAGAAIDDTGRCPMCPGWDAARVEATSDNLCAHLKTYVIDGALFCKICGELLAP